jgi:tRNA(fMet)-specific endonuclease VapC
MNAVLLDTDVFSYLMKPGDARAKAYSKHVKGKTVAVSFITYGELLFGAAKKGWGTRKIRKLEERLKAVVVVPYDDEICRTYAKVRASLPLGVTVAPNDLWIASCAIRHGIPLVSNNKKHFEKIPGLNLISENPVAAAKPEDNLKLKFDPSDETESAPSKKPASEPSA